MLWKKEMISISAGMEGTRKSYHDRYKPESFVRYRWEADEGTKNFFELTIVIDEITNDLALNVTDFADEGDEEEVHSTGIILSKIYR
jgi:hypothetical protein